jgi:hypothetical protein
MEITPRNMAQGVKEPCAQSAQRQGTTAPPKEDPDEQAKRLTAVPFDIDYPFGD